MAKTEAEISKELQESISTTNPTLDVYQGPIPNIMIRPQTGIMAELFAENESLRKLFTIEFDSSITDEEVIQALGNYGSSPGGGTKARVVQYFLRFTKPTVDITIPAGTLVSTIDGSLVYKVVDSGVIRSSSPSLYYNADTNAYEIGLIVEALGTGSDYAVSPGRINTFLTTVQGIDSTENRSTPENGEQVESRESQISRLKTALLGINKGSPGGMSAAILELANDVSIIQPKDPEFKRIMERPALDVVVLGNSITTISETYTATSGQNELYLNNVPVIGIASVSINGLIDAVPWSFEKDYSDGTGLSIRAEDKIVFTSLSSGDVIEVSYEYNSKLSEVNNTVFSDNEYLFDTDILLREPKEVNAAINMTIKVLPSYTSSEVELEINSFLEGYFTFVKYKEVIYPKEFKDALISDVSGIQTVTLIEFRRNTGSLSTIEPLFYAKNEASVYDSTLITVNYVGQ